VTARRAAWIAGALMLAVYAATLAPDVTFWDAGEFISAARVLGIPHPPGTPLYIFVLNAWARLFWFVPFAVATNLFSAVCTAAAVAITARWISRGLQSAWVALAAAVTAGAMTSVWQNATETEVYAASLALAIGAMASADRVGRAPDPQSRGRWLALTAYLLALAVPLHASVLLAAPVVVYLAFERADGARDWRAGLVLLGVAVISAGLNRVSKTLIGVGVLLIVGAFVLRRAERPIGSRTIVSIVGAVVLGLSSLLFLLVRARHDPAINQGNPSTWTQLAYVVGRLQYDLPGLWPRRAPLWLQFANWFEYADWQFALSLGPTVIPTVWRVLATCAFVGLALWGSAWQRRADVRTWRATVLLFLCGSLGALVYLNLKAGATFAWEFVPEDVRHEARDRDYFFVLGFWAWGIWAGLGAMRLASRLRTPALVGVGLAALPIALNWSPMNRRAEPEASLPRLVGTSFLEGLPPRAVLFVAGDNDSYPLWYAQQVLNERRDVTVVTLPLLAAPWYIAELERRDSLLASAGLADVTGRAHSLMRSAIARGRPVAVALTVSSEERNRLWRSWKVIGLSALAVDDGGRQGGEPATDASPVIRIDSSATRAAAASIARRQRGGVARPGTDPVHEYFLRVLTCPRFALDSAPTTVQLASLDSTCNLR